ncbi:MAG: hypothetical protein ACYC7D_11255 [Nitrososphaerales archaeon]
MSSEPSRTITVKLKKGGWEVEITCTESQLKQAIESVLSSLETPQASNMKSMEGSAAGNKTCRGLIMELWQEGWFSEARALSEVHEEISRRGYHYDRTAVSHSLTDLVRENTLTRQGNMRNYSYIQKRPANLAIPGHESKTKHDEKVPESDADPVI